MELKTGGATDKGKTRTNNEDSLCCDPAAGFFAVADGMGGAAAGEVASRTAVQVVGDYIRKIRKTAGAASRGDGGQNRLRTGISLANEKIREAAMKNHDLRGMGTTITAVDVEGPVMSIANVGDSRVYMIRSGVMTQLTEDHSLVAEEVRAGLLSKEEAEASLRRNIITRALGQEEALEIDTSEIALMDGDRVLLCSDGLTTMVHDDIILSTVLAHDRPEDGCAALVSLANKNGGRDNITVILIYLEDPAKGNIISRFFRFVRR